MDNNSINKNRTLFYAPLWANDFEEYCGSFDRDSRFFESKEKGAPQYFLPYVTSLYEDNGIYRIFSLAQEHLPQMCMYREKLALNTSPRLESVKIHCFATGCAFVEFSVAYEDLSLDEIENFAYEFKKVTKIDRDHGYTVSMKDVLTDFFLDGKNAELNFSGADFKQECRSFHHIFIEEKPDDDTLKAHLRRLARGYKTSFDMPTAFEEYDMIYFPYDYDFWAGSPEGIVNLFSHGNDADTNYYIDNYKRTQLINNYSFMYLILLNQRFTTIRLISQISKYNQYTKAEKKRLNEQIVELKTVFSFNVVSDDQLYQNVYKKMYDLMDIDHFLTDIKDNEQQVEMLRNYESLETEKRTSSFLLVLSILSIFSVLIDAASYFDRISLLKNISTVLSFAFMVTITSLYFAWWIRYMRK